MAKGVTVRALVVAVLSGVPLLAPAPALGHDHRPPDATIVTPRDSAEGNMYTSSWAQGDGRYCSAGVSDGIPGSSDPVQWLPGDELAVRFATRHRPVRVNADAFLLGDPTTGIPIHGHVELPTSCGASGSTGPSSGRRCSMPPLRRTST